MSLLYWFLQIPGHEQNVRVPAVANIPKVTIDTIETEQPPMTLTWGSTPGSSWDFDMSFQVKQGIPSDLTWENYDKVVRIRPETPIVSHGVPIPGGEYGVTDDEALAIAMAATGKAALQGVLIASIDGPIPVMDIFGFAWATYQTHKAWEEYRKTTQ